jgi:CHASE3 domain sensor protein
VARLSRVVLGALGVATAVSALVLLLLVTVQAPRVTEVNDGARAIRRSHLAMVDQETGLRAFLLTRDTALLEPYERGRAELELRNAEARRAFAGDEEQLARLRRARGGAAAWLTGWAEPARDGRARRHDARAFVAEGKALFDDYRDGEARASGARTRCGRTPRTGRSLVLVLAVAVEVALLLGVATLLRREFLRLRADVVTPGRGPRHDDRPPARGRPRRRARAVRTRPSCARSARARRHGRVAAAARDAAPRSASASCSRRVRRRRRRRRPSRRSSRPCRTSSAPR